MVSFEFVCGRESVSFSVLNFVWFERRTRVSLSKIMKGRAEEMAGNYMSWNDKNLMVFSSCGRTDDNDGEICFIPYRPYVSLFTAHVSFMLASFFSIGAYFHLLGNEILNLIKF